MHILFADEETEIPRGNDLAHINRPQRLTNDWLFKFRRKSDGLI